MSRAQRRLEGMPVSRTRWLVVFAIQALTVLSVVPWRTGDLYAGGIDPVVAAKAVIGVSALGLAVLYWLRSPVRGSVGFRTVALFLGIVLVSVVGAFATDNAGPDVVLAVRLVLVAATIQFIVLSVPHLTALTTMLSAMGVVAIIAAVTGASSALGGGRLAGGIPQMAPNVLAGLAAAPAIGLAVHIIARGLRPWNVALLVLLFALVLATGSRTSLIVIVLGIVLAFVVGGRVPISTTIATIAIFPFAYGLVAFTDTVAKALSRGQSIEEISTLSSRTVAWQAVFATPFDSWPKWIGVGLAAQTVAVQQRWRDVQVLDSSWVSVIAQAGIIGTLLLIIWTVTTGADSLRSLRLTAITTPLFLMLVLRSFTENGLIESSPTFVVFFTVSLVLERQRQVQDRVGSKLRYAVAVPLPRRRRTLSPSLSVDDPAGSG